MATLHTVTLPDGTERTRKSANHVYGYAIATASSVGRRRAYLERVLPIYLERGGVRDDALAADARAKLAELEGRDDDDVTDWGVLAWSSRSDLAQKRADQARRNNRAWAAVIVLPARTETVSR